jgi:hypothetical protein
MQSNKIVETDSLTDYQCKFDDINKEQNIHNNSLAKDPLIEG